MPISKLAWIDLRPMIPTGACELFTIVTLLGAVDIVHQPARQGVEEELEGTLRTVQEPPEGFTVSCHAIEMASPCSAAASLLTVSGGDRPFQVLRRTCQCSAMEGFSRQHARLAVYSRRRIAKVGFGRKPALYPGRAESRLFDMALKLSKMV
jgi:hypothetical protein